MSKMNKKYSTLRIHMHRYDKRIKKKYEEKSHRKYNNVISFFVTRVNNSNEKSFVTKKR